MEAKARATKLADKVTATLTGGSFETFRGGKNCLKRGQEPKNGRAAGFLSAKRNLHPGEPVVEQSHCPKKGQCHAECWAGESGEKKTPEDLHLKRNGETQLEELEGIFRVKEKKDNNYKNAQLH